MQGLSLLVMKLFLLIINHYFTIHESITVLFLEILTYVFLVEIAEIAHMSSK